MPIVGRLYDFWRRGRRLIDPRHWTSRLTRLPIFDEPHEPGLVLIQIDGLSEAELRRAVELGNMPHVRRLIDRDGYQLSSVYSGLPSTTPAAQGELFYGRRAAVPAFAFGDRRRRKIVDMLDSDLAASIEAELAAEAEGTLAGGSSYSNIYGGGAGEPHFNAATLGWNRMFRHVGPPVFLLIVLWNAVGLLRLLLKLVVEIVLACGDLLLGLIGRRDLKREFEAIPSRLGVGIVLEELITMAAGVDVTRGLPIVQLNYLSYDERAHLRGPPSAYAHQALRRIDAAIGRVVSAAERSEARAYDVWIYSDHGQESTTPYDALAGRTFVDAVVMAFDHSGTVVSHEGRERSMSRYRYLRRGRAVPTRLPEDDDLNSNESDSRDDLIVAAIGPVGHIYLPPMPEERIEQACRRLCDEHQVPLVLRRLADGALHGFTAAGSGPWTELAETWIGRDHPFLRAIVEDVPRLCEHPRAGDVVVVGWRQGLRPISFVRELGAHAGFAPRETGAFVLTPRDVTPAPGELPFLRHTDIRRAVRVALKRDVPSISGIRAARTATQTLRVVSYNVHSCVGLDGRLSPARIARVLARCDADVVALQELDVMRSRTGHIDQVETLARLLGLESFHFFPALRAADERYGDALLSRLPMTLVRAAALPQGEHLLHREPRGALWGTVEWQGRAVQIVNTHLGLSAGERALQTEALLGRDWLGNIVCNEPVVLCGDFNMRPGSSTFRRIVRDFADCQNGCSGRRASNTWFSPLPLARIDHVFVRGPLRVVRIDVPRTALTVVASDHLPLVVDLEWSA